MIPFAHHVLRTTDEAAARAFYEAVLGAWPAGSTTEPLPAVLIARGAPPHWLGHLAVADPEVTAAALVADGATRLGTSPDQRRIVLRDPCGAVIALAGPSAPRGSAVVWSHLATPDVDRSVRVYRRHLDGAPGAPGTSTSVAAITDPVCMHPAWTFFFGVHDLDAARAKVRSLGGLALDPVVTPTGARVCACDDPQGAAFGLFAAV